MSPPRLGVWPPLPLGVYARRPVDELPFPLDDGCAVFARARHGLHHGVRAAGLGEGDEVLTPAWHHGSEIEALIRAGLRPRFYEATPTLAPDPDELEALRTPATRALYLTHFLGLPQDAPRWRAWCDERGLLLVEDAAQAWLARVGDGPVGSWGDVAIFCLYKTYGLPDGAALVVREQADRAAPAAAPEVRGGADGALRSAGGPLRVRGVLRRHAGAVLARSGALSDAAVRLQRPTPYDPAADFALGDAGGAASAALPFLLRRLAADDAAAGRRAHYEELLAGLAPTVPEAFRTLPPGASPFAFPVETDRKEELLGRLADAGIGGLDLWSVPHPSVPAGAFPRAGAMRRRLVGLPVHQELRPADVERIARAAAPRPPARPAGDDLALAGSLEELRDGWDALAHARGNIFATWDWTATWWQHFGAGSDLRLWACRDPGGRLFALLPLVRSGDGPLRMLRFLGHGHGDHLGAIAAPRDRARAAAMLRRALRRERFDLFLGDKLPAPEGWAAFLGARVLRRAGGPVLRFGGASWEGLLAGRSSNFRGQVRSRERRLARAHDLRFRLCDDPDRLTSDLDTLFALNAARWPGDRWFAGATEAFHRDFAAIALRRGWLRLWLLEVDGEPVAAWYGFRFAGAESYYQAGRDPAWDRWSVGFVLLAHTIRAAVQDGMAEYRFLEGGEAYKYRFANADPGLETIALAGSPAGSAAVAAAVALGRRPAFAALGRRIAA
jgi:dTDP-4-amino-4,6-dideoxygalactose transaminase/CelD/BcsL family acetyltransferase involved in cellulose biosynthesis